MSVERTVLVQGHAVGDEPMNTAALAVIARARWTPRIAS